MAGAHRLARQALDLALQLVLGLGVLALVLYGAWRLPPQWNPFVPLDVRHPAGPFDRFKLARLSGDFPACRAFLDQAGLQATPLPDRPLHDGCGWHEAVMASGSRQARWSPVPLACPAAAALALWEHRVLQPQAQALLGAPVVRMEHFGSFACRNVAGTGRRSGHAQARAFDFAGVVLDDGRRISVVSHWDAPPDAAAFLHAVRDGACGVFGQVLSPDYNAAHRDHLHLEQGGWRACR